MVFANPAGFWALLALPVLLAIHFLQRQARVLPVSTLFLLEQTQRESLEGRTFDKIRSSIPLWLQILGVLLLTWLLVEPRYVRANSTQQVAVVLDSSGSMSAFRDRVEAVLAKKLPELQGEARRLRLFLIADQGEAGPVYAGESISEGLAALEMWEPRGGAASPDDALRQARSLVGGEGVVVYLTDELHEELPFSAELLAVGEPRENLGFTGVGFEETEDGLVWRALVKNFGLETARAKWVMEFPDGSKSEEKEISLGAGEFRAVSGKWPEEVDRLLLRLGEDAMALDNVLPLVRPEPKKLRFSAMVPPEFGDFVSRLEAGVPNLERASDELDFRVFGVSPLSELPEIPGLVLLTYPKTRVGYLRGGLVAEKDRLTEGLNFQSLLVPDSSGLPHTGKDQVLLWQGQRALIFRRELEKGGEQLVFNFDFLGSNAVKLPATAVFLLRYAEGLRAAKVGFERVNTETGELLEVAAEGDLVLVSAAGETKVAAGQRDLLRAPERPGFFEVREGGEVMLESAARFGDSRESDLRDGASLDEAYGEAAAAVARNTREDHLWRVWVLVFLAAVILAWWFSEKKREGEGVMV